MRGKRIKHIIKGMALLLWTAMGGSCSERADMNVPSKGEVPIIVNLPQMYSPVSVTRAEPNDSLIDEKKKFLPEGSTLRLIVIKNNPIIKERILQNKVICYEDVEPSCIRNKGTINEDIGYTYILQQDKNETTGPQNMIPCTLTYDDNDADNDNDKTEITSIKSELFPYTIPVTGEKQTYYCVAISPAKRVLKEDFVKEGVTLQNVLKVTVRNQETFLSSNNNWTQTQLSTFTVPDNVTEPAVITLNPIMHTTARIKITVIGGDFISKMQPGSPLFEIDRVPTEPGDSWLVDKDDDKDQGTQDQFTNPTLNLCIGDDIEPQMGNNILYNRMYVPSERAKTDSIMLPPGYTGHDHVPYLPRIIAETTVLPMDSRPTPMIIRLNLFINNVPMQFQYQTSKKFEPGHSYDYTATIHLRPNEMYIATWQDVSWKTDVYPE